MIAGHWTVRSGAQVEVRIRRQDTLGELSLRPHEYLVIGHTLGEPTPFQRIDFDIKGLSRRAVELYNSGHSLSIASYQEPSGVVRVIHADLDNDNLRKNTSRSFVPPFSLKIQIEVGDDMQLAFRVSCGVSVDDQNPTELPQERRGRNHQDWLLAINALACAAEDGLPLTNGSAKEYFNPAVKVSATDTYRWPRARADLAAKYGVSPADLKGLLLAGKSRRDVKPDIQDGLRAHRNEQFAVGGRPHPQPRKERSG